eukprot:15424953-Alexandrium_andersonii.AAC.1
MGGSSSIAIKSPRGPGARARQFVRGHLGLCHISCPKLPRFVPEIDARYKLCFGRGSACSLDMCSSFGFVGSSGTAGL